MLKFKDFREKLYEAVVKAVCRHDGVTYKPKSAPVQKPSQKGLYKVQVGAFANKSNADKLAAELKEKGYSTFIVHE